MLEEVFSFQQVGLYLSAHLLRNLTEFGKKTYPELYQTPQTKIAPDSVQQSLRYIESVKYRQSKHKNLVPLEKSQHTNKYSSEKILEIQKILVRKFSRGLEKVSPKPYKNISPYSEKSLQVTELSRKNNLSGFKKLGGLLSDYSGNSLQNLKHLLWFRESSPVQKNLWEFRKHFQDSEKFPQNQKNLVRLGESSPWPKNLSGFRKHFAYVEK